MVVLSKHHTHNVSGLQYYNSTSIGHPLIATKGTYRTEMFVELGERSPAASLNLSKKNETICHGLTKHGVKKMKYDLTLWLGLNFYILM